MPVPLLLPLPPPPPPPPVVATVVVPVSAGPSWPVAAKLRCTVAPAQPLWSELVSSIRTVGQRDEPNPRDCSVLVPGGITNGRLPVNCPTAKSAVVHGSPAVAFGAVTDVIETASVETEVSSSFGFENPRSIGAPARPGHSAPAALPLTEKASPSLESAPNAPPPRTANARAPASATETSRRPPRPRRENRPTALEYRPFTPRRQALSYQGYSPRRAKHTAQLRPRAPGAPRWSRTAFRSQSSVSSACYSPFSGFEETAGGAERPAPPEPEIASSTARFRSTVAPAQAL